MSGYSKIQKKTMGEEISENKLQINYLFGKVHFVSFKTISFPPVLLYYMASILRGLMLLLHAFCSLEKLSGEDDQQTLGTFPGYSNSIQLCNHMRQVKTRVKWLFRIRILISKWLSNSHKLLKVNNCYCLGLVPKGRLFSNPLSPQK